MKDYLIDTHAHIDMLLGVNEESEIEIKLSDILDDMKNLNVKKAIIPAVEASTLDEVNRLSKADKNIYGMVGIFPTEAKTYTNELELKMKSIANSNSKIVAVGEIGLDYYWDKTYEKVQQDVFRKQIKMANYLELPVVVHDRDAHKDCFDILKQEQPKNGVLFHCFSGSVEFMKECVKEGWLIAIGGVVTFKNALKIKDVAKEVPLENLVLETDSPYLTPVPYRGKQNKPAYVKYVAEEISKIRGMQLEELIDVTTANAERFFRI